MKALVILVIYHILLKCEDNSQCIIEFKKVN